MIKKKNKIQYSDEDEDKGEEKKYGYLQNAFDDNAIKRKDQNGSSNQNNAKKAGTITRFFHAGNDEAQKKRKLEDVDKGEINENQMDQTKRVKVNLNLTNDN